MHFFVLFNLEIPACVFLCENRKFKMMKYFDEQIKK